MKKLLLTLGAFMALFSYSVDASAALMIDAPIAAMSDTIGNQDGMVLPTNVVPCDPRIPRAADPPLPTGIPNATWYNTDWPPIKYQTNAIINVIFESPEQIQTEMSHGKSCVGTFFAYQEGNNLHLPNPCKYPKTDAYAKLVCHELGHYNGWPIYHGDS